MPINPIAAVLRPEIRAERVDLARASVCGVVAVVADLARPWPLAIAVDLIAAPAAVPVAGLPAGVLLGLCGSAVIAITAAAGWLELSATVRTERAAERIGASLRRRVFDHAIGLSPRWHDEIRSGELMSRLGSDIGRLLDALVTLTATVVPDLLRLSAVLLVLVLLDPWLAAVGLAVLPVLAVLAVGQRRRVRATSEAARSASGRFTATTLDLLRNVRAIQAFGRTRHGRDVFSSASSQLRDAQIGAATAEARWRPVADTTLAVGAGLVLTVGGGQALTGELAPGALVVVMSYLAALYSPVRSLSRLSGVLAKASVSGRRVQHILAATDQVAAPVSPRPAPLRPAEIRFQDVVFGYDATAPVLGGLDLVIRAGETVCLVGPSGAGKSTVLNLVLRLYDVDSGSVTVDGIDLRTLDPDDWRRKIAFVPQDPWLLDATVAENIAVGGTSLTWHAIRRAAQLARVDEFIGRLPQGYDTVLGEGGSRLSGGQRRRIALARAIVTDAPVLLLDEPTASLDPFSAAAVTDAIRAAAPGRAVLIVTHDRELAAIADRVIEISTVAGRSVVLSATDVVADTREEVFP